MLKNMLRSHFLPKLIVKGVKNTEFHGFCSNLRNMGMILERLGMTTGKKPKVGDGEGTGMGKMQKTGMGKVRGWGKTKRRGWGRGWGWDPRRETAIPIPVTALHPSIFALIALMSAYPLFPSAARPISATL